MLRGRFGKVVLVAAVFAQLFVPIEAGSLFFPQFVQGDSVIGYYVTEIALQNRTNHNKKVYVFFRGDDGNSLPVQLADGRIGDKFEFFLAAGASTVLRSAGAGALKVGWVEVRDVSDPPEGQAGVDSGLAGVLTFRYYEKGTLKTEVAVPPSDPSPAFMIPVEYSDTSNTGVAIAGVSALLATPGPDYCCARLNLALILLDQNGSIVATKKTFNLFGYSHIARFVNEIFPELHPPFKGTLIIAVGGPSGPAPAGAVWWPRRAAVVGLQVRDELLSSIPATPKSYLPAFARIPEVEGNDTIESAQPIPLIPFTLEAAFNTVTYGVWDTDHFTVALEKDDLLFGVMEATDSVASPIISSPDGIYTEISAPDETGSRNTTIVFRAPSSGRHTLLFRPSRGTYRFTAIRIR